MKAKESFKRVAGSRYDDWVNGWCNSKRICSRGAL